MVGTVAYDPQGGSAPSNGARLRGLGFAGRREQVGAAGLASVVNGYRDDAGQVVSQTDALSPTTAR